MRIWRPALAAAAAVALAGCADRITTPTPDAPVFDHTEAHQDGLFRFGAAWGTRVHLNGGPILGIDSDPTVVSSINACLVAGSSNNAVAGISAPPVLTTGAVETKAEPLTFPDGIGTLTESEVLNVNVLSGVITADAIRVRSTVTYRNGEFETSPAGTSFTNLTVLGLPVTVQPNLQINLPGLGFVVINEQQEFIGAHSARLTIHGLRIVITTANLLGIPVGTEIIVARASSRLIPADSPGRLWGRAYGTRALTTDGLINLDHGPSIALALPCNGGDRTRTLAGVTVPGILASGTIETRTSGEVSEEVVSGWSRSTVESINILAGLVTADLVRAQANVHSTPGTLDLNADGTTFVNLRVDGVLITNVEANTRINVAGIGTVFLNRQILLEEDKLQVRAIEVVLNSDNTLGLGRIVIRVAEARAGLR